MVTLFTIGQLQGVLENPKKKTSTLTDIIVKRELIIITVNLSAAIDTLCLSQQFVS